MASFWSWAAPGYDSLTVSTGLASAGLVCHQGWDQENSLSNRIYSKKSSDFVIFCDFGSDTPVEGWWLGEKADNLISELIDSKTQWEQLYIMELPCWVPGFPCWVLNQLQSPPKLSNVWKWLCVFFYKIHLHVWSPSNLHIVHATQYWLCWGWSWRILCRWAVIVSLCRVSGPAAVLDCWV